MTTVKMLTTTDNPWNPHTHFDEWFNWDERHGYHTSGLLARESFLSYELSESLKQAALEEAMESIVADNFSGRHTIVTAQG